MIQKNSERNSQLYQKAISRFPNLHAIDYHEDYAEVWECVYTPEDDGANVEFAGIVTLD